MESTKARHLEVLREALVKMFEDWSSAVDDGEVAKAVENLTNLDEQKGAMQR